MALAIRGPDLSSFEVTQHDFEFGFRLDLPITLHVAFEGSGSAGGGVTKLQKAGRLRPGLNFVHCNTCTDDEIRMIAESGGTVSVTPVVEMMMGLGVSPTRRMRKNGLKPSLGVDTVVSCNSDMFDQMRTTLMVERGTASEERWAAGEQPVVVDVSARTVLESATIEGARACWLDGRVGRLSPGMYADLIMLDLSDLNLFPVNDAVSTVVLAANCNNVETVVVHGKVVKRDGALVGHDLEEVRQKALESRARLYASGGVPALAWPAGITGRST
jgi:cytosine/adenosine deaminase-related metal-dependent hydrolase